MGLVRRGGRSWDGDRVSSAAATGVTAAMGAARTYGSAVVNGFRFQVEEGRTATVRPRRRQWQDGRRWRASAAGRRRGIGNSSRPAESPFAVRLPALISLILVGAVAIGSFVSVSALWVKYAADLPDARSIALQTLPQDSIVYDSTGTQELADLHKQGYRHYEQRLGDMGKLLPAATIAIEDAKFYHEPGIDVGAIVRAAWVDYHNHGAVQGASTITQQLVKLRLLGNQPTIDRKAREAILALQVEQAFTKDQILEMYLNTAFYGNNAYGIKAAAKSYYHVDSGKLDLAQASMLAGIPQNPSYNNPLVNWPGAKRRQHDVLNAMVRQKEITRAEADVAFAQDLTEATGKMFRDANIIVAPGFSAFVL
ncbi:MAG: penicillin-binding protein, partial [Candidatus Dormibacteraeota bacterium]|nr:penicillin-binding protein [Candidatus Dormibacteraeota bacterium]